MIQYDSSDDLTIGEKCKNPQTLVDSQFLFPKKPLKLHFFFLTLLVPSKERILPYD